VTFDIHVSELTTHFTLCRTFSPRWKSFLCAVASYTPTTFLTTFWNRIPLGCENKYSEFMMHTDRIIHLPVQ
jgi:hypothetical protein